QPTGALAQPSAPAVSATSPAPPRQARSGIDTVPTLAAAPKRGQEAPAPATPPPPTVSALANPSPPAAQAAPKDAAKDAVSAGPPSATVAAAPPPAPAATSQAVRDEIVRRQAGASAFAAERLKTAAAGPVVISSPDPDSQWRIVGGAV